MIGNSKVIYLQKEDGKTIKAYVVCFLLDKTTDRTYVIVSNQSGKNAKGYEVVGKEAVILSAEDGMIFKGYKSNPNLSDITNKYEDGVTLELVKEATKEETVAVIYYVYDNNALNAYRASLSTANVLTDIHFLKSWDNIIEEDIPRIVNENQYPEPAFVVYDKKNDLKYGEEGTVIPVKWTAVSDILYEATPDLYDMAFEELQEAEEVVEEIEPTNTTEEPVNDEPMTNFEDYEDIAHESEELQEAEEVVEEIEPTNTTEEPVSDEPIVEFEDEETASHELEKPEEVYTELVIEGENIIFYVYDQNVVKKYSGILTDIKNQVYEVKDIKTTEVITGANDLDVNRFLASKKVELGAYFVIYDDYNPTIENINGKLIAVATLNNPICKTEEMEQLSFEEVETEVLTVPDKVEEPHKILVFNGDIDVYDNQSHYTIWGCFCTVISENPLTIVPDKNGVKTVIYEDEKANSIDEVCQNYQNLYPNVSVYLTETEIKGAETIVLNEYKNFIPQVNMEQTSLLESGRKILTEEEMIAKRQEELENLKKKINE